MNIDDISQVMEYYGSNYTSRKELKPFIFVPSKNDRKHTLFFHGVKGKLSDECFEYQKNMFSTRIDFNENKYFIITNVNFNRPLRTVFFDGDDLFYESEIIYQTNVEYWFSPSIKFENVGDLKLKIYDEDRLIYKK